MIGPTHKKAVRYEKRIFALVDILGFADLVEDSEHDTTKILRVYRLLDLAKSMTQLPIGYKFKHLQVRLAKFRSHIFSDTITMSCPYESFHYFNAMIAWVMWYQYFMWAEEGTFLRGAIVHGNIFDEENSAIVFGPAMVAAYRLETKKAKWPRILVDSSVVKKLPDEKRLRALKEYLRKDTAGNYYLDYLHDLFVISCFDRGKRLKIPSDPIALLQNHKIAVEKAVERIREQWGTSDNSAKKGKRLLDKYRRLSRYHNGVIDRLRHVALRLQNNNDLVRSIDSEVMVHGLIRATPWQQYFNIEPKFTAENLKYVDIMPILGIASERIITEHKEPKSLAADDPVKFVNFLCEKSPRYLSELQKALDDARIEMDILGR